MKNKQKAVELDKRFPNGAFIDGVYTEGTVVDGNFITKNRLIAIESEAPKASEVECINFNYHLAQYMQKCFPEQNRSWWRVAEYEYVKLQSEMVNGKRRIRYEQF